MKLAAKVLAWMMTGTILVASGCDVPPPTPRDEAGEAVEQVVVESDAEREAVKGLVDARGRYRYRLAVLQAYYRKTGALAKQRWAEREAENLRKAQTFSFAGVSAAPVEQGPSIESVDEATLVEMTVAARKAYKAAVDNVYLYYSSSGESFKAALIDAVRRRFDPIRTYMYFLDAEVPSSDLRPARVIPEAELLYDEALKLHKSGKIVFVNYGKQREALLTFLELVRRYPDSTRIADSAYFIGNIYNRYFDEDYRAVLWYRRATQWDPHVERPARYEAARVADFELMNRAVAAQLYRDVIEYEPFEESHIEFARERLTVLEPMTAQGEPTLEP